MIYGYAPVIKNCVIDAKLESLSGTSTGLVYGAYGLNMQSCHVFSSSKLDYILFLLFYIV